MIDRQAFVNLPNLRRLELKDGAALKYFRQVTLKLMNCPHHHHLSTTFMTFFLYSAAMLSTQCLHWTYCYYVIIQACKLLHWLSGIQPLHIYAMLICSIALNCFVIVKQPSPQSQQHINSMTVLTRRGFCFSLTPLVKITVAMFTFCCELRIGKQCQAKHCSSEIIVVAIFV